MSKAFRSGFFSGALDQGTSRMKARDEAYDAMVDQTFNIIPQAIKAKEEIEYERKKRLDKANQIAKTFKIDLDAAKVFLNDFDPDGKENILTLQKTFNQLELQKDQKLIDSTKTMPTGFVESTKTVNLPTDTSSGFDKLFGKPTLADAIGGAEQRLGLTPGTGMDALNYVGPANLSPDPYRFQTSGAYSFRPESTQVGSGTLNDEKVISSDWITKVGGTAKADGTISFNPYSIKTGVGTDAFTFDDANYGPWIGTFNTTMSEVNRSRRNKNGLTIDDVNDNSELKISEGVGEIVAGMSEANRLVTVNPVFMKEDGTTNFENLKHLYSHDQSGTLGKRISESQTSIPYAGLYEVLMNNNGIKDPEELKEINSNPSLTENSVPRPQYNIGQLRALKLDKNYDTKKLTTTYKGKVMSVEDAQAAWDAEEQNKIQFLTKHIGESATQRLVAGVYGTGTYSTLHNDIDDGVAGSFYNKKYIGSENVAEQRLVTILRNQGVRENTIKAMTVDKADNLLKRGLLTKKDLSFGYEKGWILTGITLTGDDPDAKAPRIGYVKDHYRWYDIQTGRMYDSEGNILKPKKRGD